MNIDSDVKERLNALFEPLHKKAAKGSVPSIGFLSAKLSRALDQASKGVTTIAIPQDVAVAFATAAVDIWLRAVHSFLISCALTQASPIWASATGYYSSHYSVRAMAHLLGYFQVFRKRRIVRLDVSGRGYSCDVESKGAGDREHRFYWRTVKQHPQFASDALFTINETGADATDVGHRDRANYADHAGQFPTFQVICLDELTSRITHISRIHFDTPPIPRVARFPDIEAVQVVAYHRIVRFRQLLDEGVGVKNRFWCVHRNPTWAENVINFQLTEQGGLQRLAN